MPTMWFWWRLDPLKKSQEKVYVSFNYKPMDDFQNRKAIEYSARQNSIGDSHRLPVPAKMSPSKS